MFRTRVSLTLAALATTAASVLAAPAASASTLSAHALASDASVPVVVLGARLDPVTNLCAPPAVLEKRLDTAAGFLRAHPLNRVVVSGGATQQWCPAESDMMTLGLRLRGVVNPILAERGSYSTVENARNVANMLPGDNRAVLITSGDHLGRASGNFAAVGIETEGVAA